VDVINAAGIDLSFCLSDGDRRLSTRILRRVMSSSYFRPAEPNIIDRLVRLSAELRPDFVFLNQVALAGFATRMRPFLPNSCKIVALSHGLESTDLLHFIRLRKRLPLSGRVRPTASIALGQTILAESVMRKHVDIVCALSPFDVELERWVGATRVGWLPRIVEPIEFNWRPTGERLGFVGTLDHAPNLEGLVAVLDQLVRRDDLGPLRIRVVGGPPTTGSWLVRNYPIVDYLGQLDDHVLCQEAETWNAFLHPIFCHARGCSTKLATAIAWCIPVITTKIGHRGYEWCAGGLVVADDPVAFSRKCVELCDRSLAVAARDEVAKLAGTSPTREEIALRLRDLLDL
jgi:glycosyltransferase involved in cell wall biosynthesis